MAVGKNSVLKLMAATLLAEGTSTITNRPDILRCAAAVWAPTSNPDGDVARITAPDEPEVRCRPAAVRQFRASVCAGTAGAVQTGQGRAAGR